MIRTRLAFILIPLTVLLILASGIILFIVYIIIENNLSNLTDLDVLGGILFLTWIAVLPTTLMIAIMRNYVAHREKLEVNYLFGLIKHFYNYNDLKISDYTWSTTGLLIELPDKDQLTIGKNQYRNFDEIATTLTEKIRKEEIEIKYTTKLTRWLFILGGITLTLFLIGLKFQN
jgi:hypothetical protein